MAKMIVCAEDKVSDDPRKNAQLHKRGDVIDILDDAVQWQIPADHPWVMVEVAATRDQLSAFLSREPDDGSDKLLQRRAFRFDLHADRPKRLTLEQALALKRAVPAIPDPDVIQQ
jgi:hypothetical protein